jgi:hypothetical protein
VICFKGVNPVPLTRTVSLLHTCPSSAIASPQSAIFFMRSACPKGYLDPPAFLCKVPSGHSDCRRRGPGGIAHDHGMDSRKHGFRFTLAPRRGPWKIFRPQRRAPTSRVRAFARACGTRESPGRAVLAKRAVILSGRNSDGSIGGVQLHSPGGEDDFEQTPQRRQSACSWALHSMGRFSRRVRS